jgi:DNA-binding transcriptional MerR regulator
LPVVVNNKMYYRTTEAAAKIGISRSTLLRWFTNGILKDSLRRDRRGWRLFTETDIKIIEAEANRIK